MNDYIHAKLAAERAESLRAEATAHRLAKRIASRRAERAASKASHPSRRALRTAH